MVFVLLATFALLPAIARAQIDLGSSEEDPAAEQAADPYQRETPRAAVTGLIRALAAQDYTAAGQYFAVGDNDLERSAELARTLQASLDEGGELIPFGELSNDPQGRVDDQLPPDLERIGTFAGPAEVPILLSLQEIAGDTSSTEGEAEGTSQSRSVWQIAPRTIEQLDQRAARLDVEAVDSGAFVIGGAPLGDWLLLLSLLIAVFVAFRLLSALILALLRAILTNARETGAYRFLDAALPPFSLLAAAIAYRVWSSEVPVAIVARQILLRYIGIIAWIALAWFAIRLVDAVAAKLTDNLNARERRQAVSVVTLVRRIVKLLLIAIAFVAILDTFGIDVTAGVAALGIGGIALALGAQKLIENLVGSISVIADKPIQIGDVCKVGEVLGTVEDIGMRSTRIRTLNRTVVTIPNGDFSSLQIENYTRRDRFLFNPVIGVEYSLTAAQLREAIGIVEGILADHPQVSEDPCRAKLANFGASSLNIEVFAYIEVADYVESLGIRQELLLQIYERLEQAGIAIAFPTQTLYLRQEDGAKATNAAPV